jgi:protein-arginine kinase activator protein McsA
VKRELSLLNELLEDKVKIEEFSKNAGVPMSSEEML